MTETAADLPAIVAMISSIKRWVLPRHYVVFGELGLNGEIRAVPNGLARCQAAAQQGFTHALVPHSARLPQKVGGMKLIFASNLSGLIAQLEALLHQ